MGVNCKKSENQSHFDRVNDLFRVIMGDHFHWGYFKKDKNNLCNAQIDLIERIEKLCNITSKKKVLDIGCGVGGTVIYLSENYGCNIVGITNSKVGIEVANEILKSKSGKDKVEFILADALDNGLDDNSFDIVILIETSYMISDKSRLFKEIYRVLKDGGIMVLCDNITIRDMTIKELIKYNEGIISLKKIFGDGKYESLELYRKIVEESGFSEIRAYDIGKYTYKTIDYVIDSINNKYTELKEKFQEKEIKNFKMAWETTRILCDKNISSYGILSAVKK